jgi:two-component system NtrC family sensor kinase
LLREAADLFLRGTDPLRGQITLETNFAELLPPVRVDPGRLLLVLINLLTNAQDAIHQVKREGRVRIRAELDRESADGPWIKILVHDDGPGIPEMYLARVFEPCFTTKPEGSGFGLYLANEILREHGGRVTAANDAQGGACFTLWLPLEDDASKPPDPTPD